MEQGWELAEAPEGDNGGELDRVFHVIENHHRSLLPFGLGYSMVNRVK